MRPRSKHREDDSTPLSVLNDQNGLRLWAKTETSPREAAQAAVGRIMSQIREARLEDEPAECVAP